jgi:hypothetical protein
MQLYTSQIAPMLSGKCAGGGEWEGVLVYY